jgi:hypothetical protein
LSAVGLGGAWSGVEEESKRQDQARCSIGKFYVQLGDSKIVFLCLSFEQRIRHLELSETLLKSSISV